jgi:hypothetical protein
MVPIALPAVKIDDVTEFVECRYRPMVQGEKSDPPVGTGRGLKLRASKAAERGRSDLSGRPCFHYIAVWEPSFWALAILLMLPMFGHGGRKAPNRTCWPLLCGVGKDPNCLKENLK